LDAVTVYAPGSVSNLGSGFDCLGIACTGMGDTVRAQRTSSSGVRVLRVSDPRIPLQAERNTAGIAATAVLRRSGASIGLELEVEKGLALAAGLGGSAASAVAGAVAANVLLDAGLATVDLLEVALEAEAAVAGRHLDNAAPALVGGAVLVTGLDPPAVMRLTLHRSLALIVVTPGYSVETARARAVLPAEVARGRAVEQATDLACLVLGLERGDGELIRKGMVDLIAEPPRLPLYPGYAEARSRAYDAGAFGVSVSGAGPSLVGIAPETVAAAVAQALEQGYGRAGITARSHVAHPDREGTRVVG
jgi:homoserine kinase